MPVKNVKQKIPPGFTLRHTLRGHTGVINQIAWSPDGGMLASGADDKTIRLWDAQTGQQLHSLTGHTNLVLSVAWSPDGGMLASGAVDGTIQLWEVQTGQQLHSLTGHTAWVRSVAWSPDGGMLASSADDRTIRLWEVQTGQQLRSLTGHTDGIRSLAWSPDGGMLASSANDGTIRLWDPQTGRQVGILEGHTDVILGVSFSYDGYFLASKSQDNTVRIWRVDTHENVEILDEPATEKSFSGAVFHPKAPVLATLGQRGSRGQKDTVIRIWDLDVATLLKAPPATSSAHYANAKVVLIGDSGVGKSGLSLVLTGRPFAPTESTHGRNVWNFDAQEVELAHGRKEKRETVLWDLAGQPGYRLVHQLHLNEIAVALVVFDARNEIDPFAGVYHWMRALGMAQRVQGDSVPPMKKLLISARVDRGGKSVSRERIDALVQELGFDGYFETSAKEGQNVAELAAAIKQAIDWEMLPKVTSTDLFQCIKAFLVVEKEAGRLLSTGDDLYRAFLKSDETLSKTEDLQAQFETCIGRVESQGLIRRLSFGGLVLLQPELLDAYASALVNAVRDEPDGLGSIAEEKVRVCDFPMPKAERIQDKEQEKLLLIAMVEDLLRYEIALREQGDDGAYLVFPAQTTRENPNLPNAEGKAVIFGFEGPIQNVYSTLAVRLSHSGLFQKQALWKNAVTYTTKMGGTYGLFLNNIDEGRAELTLFFDKTAKEETRFHFEEYVRTHLERRALPNTMRRRRIFVCPECGTPLDDLAVTRRRERGFDWMTCGVCDRKVPLLDREERLTAVPVSVVSEMDHAADKQRDSSTAASILQGKIATGDFDVFLCHNNKDKPKVKEIGEKLKEQGILPWLDEWELRPGVPWQRLLEQQIGQIKAAAVFVGKDGMGPWQRLELEAFLREFASRGCPVIPVLLSNSPKQPALPIFLRGMTWVDFRRQEPDPMEQLIWGITGERSRTFK
jgi:GTPase SAR1 family protein